MDVTDALVSQLVRNIPYTCLVEAMTPFLNPTAIEEMIVIAFHIRNVRGGKGERQLFRDMMSVFYEYDKNIVIGVLPFIPEFGYWKDVFYLSSTLPHLLGPTLQLCAMQLLHDEHRVELGYKPSMMAKYIPKQKKKYRVFANNFAKHLYPDDCYSVRMAKTRKRIAALNKHTDAVEVKMCANEWGSIEPRRVAAVARKKYQFAFLNEVPSREICRKKFTEFLHGITTFTEPIELSISSEAYIPLREAVQYWSNSLNMVD